MNQNQAEVESNSLSIFIDYCKNLKAPKVLELGVKRSQSDRSTMHKSWIPHACHFHGTDILAGKDVDFVADVHKLSEVTGGESYDIVISCSSFEHFKYPHLAALEISKILKPNGAVFIQTHCCFPLHAHPYDYFRFSSEALESLFGTKNGITVQSTNYEFPCIITSSEFPGNQIHSSSLNINLFGIKTHKSPVTFIYELDTNL